LKFELSIATRLIDEQKNVNTLTKSIDEITYCLYSPADLELFSWGCQKLMEYILSYFKEYQKY